MTSLTNGKFNLSSPLMTIAVIVVIFFARTIYTTPPELHDVRKKWHIASSIAETGDLSVLLSQDHHSSRWGVIFPTALAIKVGGKNLHSYYSLLLLMYAIAFAILIHFARPVMETSLLILFAVLLFYEPLFFRATSQLQPFVFGFFYIAVSLWLLSKYISSRHWGYLALAALLCFFAYGAKETYVFFIPGLLLLIYLRGDLKSCVYFCMLLLLFFAIETLVFNILDPSLVFGRIEFLSSGIHLSKMSQEADSHYIDFVMEDWIKLPVFKQFIIMVSSRWLLLPIFDLALVLLTGLVIMYFIITKNFRRLPAPSQGILLLTLSYSILVSVVPSGFNPLLPLQPLLEKYLTVVLPFFIFLFCLGVSAVLRVIPETARNYVNRACYLLCGIFVSYAIVLESPIKYPFRAIDYPQKYAMYWIENDLNQAMRDGYGICETKSTTIIKIKNLFHNYMNEDNIRKDLRASNLENIVVLHHKDYTPDQLTGFLSDRNLGLVISRSQCISKQHQ